MTANEIREKYLKFFESKGHKRLPSASLVVENDPTVFFTTAGMHPLVPYLLGEKHPMGSRICNSQKCIRTGDIDEVGDNRHLTFFEMLGNWSLGDYFKKESIEWSFEFLTKELKIPIEKLAVSVFEGEAENNLPKDEEASRIWQELGIAEERIVYLGRNDNWWGPAGQTGPCGPDTEIFYWAGKERAPNTFDPTNEQWIEIWNNVFMQYNKTEAGVFELLKQKNVDTGMGLERIAAVLQGKDNVFETELFASILDKIGDISKKPYGGNEKQFRIVADHIKASVFILAEQIYPGKNKHGYVLRKLIRRAIWTAKPLFSSEKFFWVEQGKVHFNRMLECATEEVIKIYKDVYPELQKNQNFILDRLRKEEEKTYQAFELSSRQFGKIKGDVSGKAAFDLLQNCGQPLDITILLAKDRGKSVDVDEFWQEFKKHQELSRTASAGQFKAGLADHSEQTTKYHTATHLLLAALRAVLQEPIEQRGSNITAERIRFDFGFSRKLTPEEISQVENWVNDKIAKGLRVSCESAPLEEAIKKGAIASFREKYPAIVKVYTICENSQALPGGRQGCRQAGQEGQGLVSCEICSGPHIQNTNELGNFKIIKEEASSSGVRRIKAVLQ